MEYIDFEYYHKLFSERLKKLRLELNLTQAKLAEKTGVPQTTISGYETKKITPTCEAIYRLAKFFKVSSDYLIGLKD